MHDCCADTGCRPELPNKRRCPVNGIAYAAVSARTVAHHVKEPWNGPAEAKTYYFCDDPACDVVYFADDGSIIRKSQLRTRVGAKEAADDALLCYCFGVTKAAARSQPEAREYVVAQTKQGRCSCETSNPSGRCCLKDFPRPAGSDPSPGEVIPGLVNDGAGGDE